MSDSAQSARRDVVIRSRAGALPSDQRSGVGAGYFIGVNRFVDTGLNPLRFAVNDAIDFAYAFVIQLLLLDPRRTFLAIDQDPVDDNRRRKLDELLAAGVTREKPVRSTLLYRLQYLADLPAHRLFVTLSTHGFVDSILPADGYSSLLADTAISIERLNQLLGASLAQLQLVYIDACRNRPQVKTEGQKSAPLPSLAQMIDSHEGRAVIRSCENRQFSYEFEELDNGLSAHYFLRALGLKPRPPQDPVEETAEPLVNGLITLDRVMTYTTSAAERFLSTRGRRDFQQSPCLDAPERLRKLPLAIDLEWARSFDQAPIVSDDFIAKLRSKVDAAGGTFGEEQFRLALSVLKGVKWVAHEKLQNFFARAKDFSEGRIDEETWVAVIERISSATSISPPGNSRREGLGSVIDVSAELSDFATSTIIGIDLGTTNSVVAVLDGGKLKVIPNSLGSRQTPSIVAFSRNGEVLVGEKARRQQVMNPRDTVYSIKRFMGLNRNEVAQEEKRVHYEVTGGAEQPVRVKIGGTEYTPEQISAFILADLKKTAESFLGGKVTDAVITVPAYFNNAQRAATKAAGKLAGLRVLRLLPEPTAAAVAYGLDPKKQGRVCVIDFGGGTLDVSVLHSGDAVFEVISISGDSHLGGIDLDQALVSFLVERFAATDAINLRTDPIAMQRLSEASERAKCELSAATETTVNLPFIASGPNGIKHLCIDVTRDTFEKIIRSLIDKCRSRIMDALRDARWAPEQIEAVVLVGGSTRVPAVQRMVKSLFSGKEPDRSINPDEAVALGATIQGGIATGAVKKMLVLDATPITLGIEALDGSMTVMIPRNTTIPTSEWELFSTAMDNQTAITINVFEGESDSVRENRFLGTMTLEGIPLAPRGIPEIEVTLSVDVNSVLSVRIKDCGTGNTVADTLPNMNDRTSSSCTAIVRPHLNV